MWQDILKWSTTIQEAEKLNNEENNKDNKNKDLGKKEIKKMTKEDFEFLEGYFESITVNETKEVCKRLDNLHKLDTKEKDYEKTALDLIEQMSDYIDGLEVTRNLVRCKRFNYLIEILNTTEILNVKIAIINLLGNCMQNDKFVQEYAMDIGIFKYLEDFENIEKLDKKYIIRLIYLTTGMIFGESLKTRGVFVYKLQGFKYLKMLLENKLTTNVIRVYKIIQEIVKSEDTEEKDRLIVSYEIGKEFIDKKMHYLLLEKLRSIIEGKNENENNNNDDIQQSIYNILASTSLHWVEDKDFKESYNYLVRDLYNKYKTDKDKLLELSNFSKEVSIVTNKDNINKIKDIVSSFDKNFKSENNTNTNTNSNMQIMPDGGAVINIKK